jgi:predicted ABC-type ATPase
MEDAPSPAMAKTVARCLPVMLIEVNETALKRIELRVKSGGYDVPKSGVRRRFKRGWANFEARYKEVADYWAVYDNTSGPAKLILQKHE